MDTINAERVDATRLLSRSHNRRNHPRSGLAATGARRVAEILLGRLTTGSLTVVDHQRGITSHHGPGATPLRRGHEATVEVHDPQAWRAVLTEGSIGFGRGYIEGWWTSPDPTALVRLIIANLAPIDEVRNRMSRLAGPTADRVRLLLPRSGRRGNREEISAHYDVGNRFFELFLDETMTYSSAIFPDPATDLESASLHKYDTLIDSLDLGPDHHLLEIGTGWGGMAIRAAQRTGCRVTTTTISSEQLHLARQRVQDAGLADRIEVIDRDWRDLTGTYDRVVSVEMIEAVDWRDYSEFFRTIERCLEDDGRALIQAICVPDRRYHRTKNTEDFIRRFIFPGGYLPSIGAVVDSVSRSTRMQLVGVSDFSAHYAETLRRWRDRFDEQRSRILGLGLDERFCRLWNFYLAYCEAGFLERHCTVNHFALAGPQWRDDLAMVPAPVT